MSGERIVSMTAAMLAIMFRSLRCALDREFDGQFED